MLRLILLSLFSLFSFFSPLAWGQSVLSYEGYDHVARITKALPGVTTVANANGVVATAANDVTIKPSNIKIPVSVAANVPKARILAGALGCATPLGALMCAATAAAVINELANQPVGMGRYRICPDGTASFICKETSQPDVAPSVNSGWRHNAYSSYPLFSSGQGFCTHYATNTFGAAIRGTFVGQTASTGYCALNRTSDGSLYANEPTGVYSNDAATCGAGYTMVGSACKSNAPPVVSSASDTEVAQSLQQKMDAEYEANRRLYDAMKADQAAAGDKYPSTRNPVASDTPVVVTASPVTTPEVVTKTEVITNPDGTTSTRTTGETTTFTPESTGTTAADSRLKIPAKTTTTVVTVNNATGATATDTTVANHAPIQPAEKVEIPDDYNREATQKEMLDELKAANAPTIADQEQRVQEKTTEITQKIQGEFDKISPAFDADKAKWFSWVWTPPVGQCTPFAGAVHGYAISFDLCPTVNQIKEALGWFFALMAAWQIYGLIFRRPA
jgi:hypothetical protein